MSGDAEGQAGVNRTSLVGSPISGLVLVAQKIGLHLTAPAAGISSSKSLATRNVSEAKTSVNRFSQTERLQQPCRIGNFVWFDVPSECFGELRKFSHVRRPTFLSQHEVRLGRDGKANVVQITRTLKHFDRTG
jgi:hypothetical protein